MISTAKAEPATMNPERNMTKNAGPSAESANEKSRPQCSQRRRRVRKPAKSLPLPQRGQQPHSPAIKGDGAWSEETDMETRICAVHAETAAGRCRLGRALARPNIAACWVS